MYVALALKFIREIIIALLVLALTVVLVLYGARGHQIDTLRADHAAQIQSIENVALTAHANNQERLINAINKAEQQTAINERYASDARHANDSLRDTIGKLREQVAAVSADARIEYTNSLTDVLAECSTEYLEMARKADGHARDSQMMIDAWPTE